MIIAPLLLLFLLELCTTLQPQHLFLLQLNRQGLAKDLTGHWACERSVCTARAFLQALNTEVVAYIFSEYLCFISVFVKDRPCPSVVLCSFRTAPQAGLVEQLVAVSVGFPFSSAQAFWSTGKKVAELELQAWL